MTFNKICTLDDIWEGDMGAFDANGHEILLIWPEGGQIKAFQGVCPHQEISLIEGKFDGKTLVCSAHQWQFDACTGKGINPGDCRLAEYPLKVVGDEVFVSTEGVEPLFFAHG